MNRCSLLAALSSLLPLCAQQARLEGKVTSARDGAPVAVATVSVRITLGDLPSPADPFQASFTATTDRDGAYAVEVKPGRYVVYAEGAGFVRRFFGVASSEPPRSFAIAEGQTRRDVDIALLPQGALSGRVLDSNGDPISAAEVTAVRVAYSEGQKQTFPSGVYANTSADGAFRIQPLPPGRYFVVATKRPAQGSAERRRLRRSFYPEAAAFENALAVRVAAGADVRGIDVRMPLEEVFRVSGKLNWNGLQAPPNGLTLWMMPATRTDLMIAIRAELAVVGPDGTFQFAAVGPGEYYLEPRGDPRQTEKFSGRLAVEIRNADVEGLEFRLMAPAAVSGRVRLENTVVNGVAVAGVKPAANLPMDRGIPSPPPPPDGGPTPPPATPAAFVPTPLPANTSTLGAIQIALRAVDRVPINAPTATSSADGTFRMTSVAPGRYRVAVGNLPEGAYLRSMRMNGQDVTDGVADMTAGFGGTIEVVMAAGAAGVNGVVRDPERKPAAGVWVSVWSDSGVQTTLTDAQGAFHVEHLAPGEYRAVAWGQMDAGLAAMLDFCNLFAGDGRTFKVDTGGRASVDLTPVPLARIEATGWALPF